MKYSIDKLVHKDEFNNNFEIDLGGKNLIITGNNGSGKTNLLKRLYASLEQRLVSTGDNTLTQARQRLNEAEQQLMSRLPGDSLYDYYLKQKSEATRLIDNEEKFSITFNDERNFKISIHERKSIIRFFEATRQASIRGDGSISGMDKLLQEHKQLSLTKDSGVLFERYLVSYWNYGLLQKGSGNDIESERVFSWIAKINQDLKVLFEDESLTLDFNLAELRIYLMQNGKSPFRLDQLSSGFSSVLSVYADLLVKVELEKLSRQEISGIVLIDEIDAHLHVTLQKKVFSFFNSAFPNIQFIITTHSPFVVQSVSDCIVFNLSTLESMQDLSMYSYTSIIKGLLGETSESETLKEKIKLLESIFNKQKIDVVELKKLVSELEPYIDKMDAGSKIKIALAQNKIIELLGE
ncbi:ATP-binding protein [Salmonella enterica]|uniref:ATP-binding protein n=1 Tax=Salmonella diarizonae TaxID=59204 RepID=A0A702GEJ3_SALDZ|nr:ATP-binding protein [Salmonella enterica subsp. enterica serovar Chester]EAT4483520.1 ATP-binding protein [Salmonella enterica]ECC1574414.1 ATP-binding protein [Salmonella enterica subsp. diarizonae]ECS6770950.1 ATP-binding protein [Salmonella enterica subsp. diarizonae serovar 65:z10:e,n,x,z15]ECV5249678.1 ATP-binding protein [Salmonella enterica subsp. enterica]